MLLEITPSPEFKPPLPPPEGRLVSELQPVDPEKVLALNRDEVSRHLADSALFLESERTTNAHHDGSTLLAMRELFTGEYIKASNGENYAHPFGRDTEHVIDFSLSALRAVASDG